eukprot:2960740-Rhodomonas_salina.3
MREGQYQTARRAICGTTGESSTGQRAPGSIRNVSTGHGLGTPNGKWVEQYQTIARKLPKKRGEYQTEARRPASLAESEYPSITSWYKHTLPSAPAGTNLLYCHPPSDTNIRDTCTPRLYAAAYTRHGVAGRRAIGAGPGGAASPRWGPGAGSR